MKPNMGTADRVIRALLGIVILSLVFVGPKSPWGWLGLLPLAQGIFGVCFLYMPFHFSTRKAA